MGVLWVDRGIDVEVNKTSAGNVAVWAIDVFKSFDALTVARGEGIVLE